MRLAGVINGRRVMSTCVCGAHCTNIVIKHSRVLYTFVTKSPILGAWISIFKRMCKICKLLYKKLSRYWDGATCEPIPHFSIPYWSSSVGFGIIGYDLGGLRHSGSQDTDLCRADFHYLLPDRCDNDTMNSLRHNSDTDKQISQLLHSIIP